jgi:antagonist of KipI
MPLPTFEVLKAGFLTTIQDRGRFHYQWRGVSMSGALDSFSYRIGNLLVGNKDNAASLEITVVGPSFRVLQDTLIAITGANMTPMKNGASLPRWTCLRVNQGEAVSFGPLKEGCRGYLSVRHGISAPLLLGSRSTNLNSKEGGIEGRPLQKGDVLESEPLDNGNEFERKTLSSELIPRYYKSVTVRVILGPQTRYFEKEAGIETFLQSEYVVTPQANRSGYRLDGPPIEHKQGMPTSIPSEGCCPGGIQVPENGKPIILLADQHGGGYAKIATVISTDLERVAQLKPGDKIRFERVSVATSHRILKEKERTIQAWMEKLDF